MTTQTMLTKVIEYAVENGWDELEMWSKTFTVSIDGVKSRNRVWIEYEYGDGEMIMFNDIIFSKSFCQAVFGDQEHEPYETSELEVMECENCAWSVGDTKYCYQYHMHQLLDLENDTERIDYLFNYIKGEK